MAARRGSECRYLIVLTLALALLATAARAQQPAAAAGEKAPSAEEVEALIARMRAKIERLSRATEERDKALDYLREQVEKATGLIGARTETAESFKSRSAELSARLEILARDRERLSGEIQSREQLLAELEQRVAALNRMLGLGAPGRKDLPQTLDRLRLELETALNEREVLRAELETREKRLAELEARLAELEQERERERAQLRAERSTLERKLEERERRLSELMRTVDVDRERIAALNGEIARLNRQLASFKELLGSMDAALEEATARNARQQIVIANLNARLTEALARKVQELEQYRSEFFGRLRKVLGNRPDIKIVGDRFVFQAELLFPSGSARLDPEGRKQLEKLAETLREVAARIPDDIDWVLRVDGHTDKVPLKPDSPYRSNWELSTERALTVVEFLIDHGIPPHRLAAAGFGEYQPIDPGDSEEAYRRNRRIEFTLTAR